MSFVDGDAVAGAVADLNAQEANPPVGGEPTGEPQGQLAPSAESNPAAGYDTTGLSPYAQNFLAGLPEGERVKASEYVRNWDKGYQSQSQQWAAQMQPYRQLGDPQTIQQKMLIADRLAADPHGFVEALVQAGYGPQQIKQAMQGQNPGAPNNGQGTDPYEGLPPSVAQELRDLSQFKQQQSTWQQRVEAAIGGLAEQYQNGTAAQEAAEADRALANLTADAHTRLGAFDDNIVYTLMQRQPGLSMDAAVQQFRNLAQQYSQPTKNPAPPVMSASSLPNPAPGTLDTAEKRNQALADWVASMNSQ